MSNGLTPPRQISHHELLGPAEPWPKLSEKDQRRLGFTGTRAGMSRLQTETVARLLWQYRPSLVRHGDCIGADEQFHELARSQGFPIELLPSNIPNQRAFCQGARHIYPDDKPLLRNARIVIMSDFIIAAPKEFAEEL